MALKESQKRFLRTLAHSRKPVVIVGGAGVSPGVLAEIDQALEAHELIKVRVNAEDREAREEMVQAILASSGAELVQRIGHIAVLYRQATKPRIVIPKV